MKEGQQKPSDIDAVLMAMYRDFSPEGRAVITRELKARLLPASVESGQAAGSRGAKAGGK